MNRVQEQDIQFFVSHFRFSERLQGKTFLITGATGLIGSTLINCLLALKKGIRIIAPVRNVEKAKEIFQERFSEMDVVECDLLNFNGDEIGRVDYIIHCAAPTSSLFFVEHPVETAEAILFPTSKILNYARKYNVESVVYLSSLEVYGNITDDSTPVSEDVQGYIHPMSVRSSYPMAKRAAENLCHLYAKEYDVPVKVARLTQTTGGGIAKDDNRVIAQFTRLAFLGNDIILHSTGESARPYCYIIDAVNAIFLILLKGVNGEAYNVANENTYISAREMADFLRDNYNPKIHVQTQISEGMGYAPVSKLRLSSKKLSGLGWQPHYDLKDIFDRLMEYFKELL